MSWGRVENPKKVFKVGETVKVLIKDINGDKIALSLKFPEENPWLNAADKYAVGNVVEGCVARMTDFGAFVELEPGVDALLHVSQISREIFLSSSLKSTTFAVISCPIFSASDGFSTCSLEIWET